MSKRTHCLVMGMFLWLAAVVPAGAGDDLVRIGLTTLGCPAKLSILPSGGCLEVFDLDANHGLFSGPAPAGAQVSASGRQISLSIAGRQIYQGPHRMMVSSVGRPPSFLTLALSGRKGLGYRGSVELQPLGGGIRLINHVHIEDYLLSVVPCEIDPDGKPAALMAQAIAARTYLLHNPDRHGPAGYSLCDRPHCQAYSGMRKESPECSKAVRETAGQILTFNGEPINAMYHCNCGGTVRSVREVFGGRGQPYLTRHPDRIGGGPAFCSWAGHHRRQRTTTRVVAAAPRSQRGRPGRGDTGLPRQVAVNTPMIVRGSRNPASPATRVITRTVSGYGHGVGMCQDGAIGMARAGYQASQILAFYYPGTQLVKRAGGQVVRVGPVAAMAPAVTPTGKSGGASPRHEDQAGNPVTGAPSPARAALTSSPASAGAPAEPPQAVSISLAFGPSAGLRLPSPEGPRLTAKKSGPNRLEQGAAPDGAAKSTATRDGAGRDQSTQASVRGGRGQARENTGSSATPRRSDDGASADQALHAQRQLDTLPPVLHRDAPAGLTDSSARTGTEAQRRRVELLADLLGREPPRASTTLPSNRMTHQVRRLFWSTTAVAPSERQAD